MIINYYGGKNMLSNAFMELCNKKMDKFNRMHPNAVVDVMLDMDAKDHVLKINFNTNKQKIAATAKSNDMYKNIDECIEILKNQLSRDKNSKIKRNKKREEPNYEMEF